MRRPKCCPGWQLMLMPIAGPSRVQSQAPMVQAMKASLAVTVVLLAVMAMMRTTGAVITLPEAAVALQRVE